MITKDELLNFNWIGMSATSKKCYSSYDVSITLRKVGFAFIFRNHDICKLLNASRLEFAFVNDDTIAFRGSSRGYKIVSKSKDASTFEASFNCTHKPELLKRMSDFVGDYKLEHDKTFDLYYIKKGS